MILASSFWHIFQVIEKKINTRIRTFAFLFDNDGLSLSMLLSSEDFWVPSKAMELVSLQMNYLSYKWTSLTQGARDLRYYSSYSWIRIYRG